MSEKVIIVTAPSGAGKTTIVKHLLQQYPQLSFSVSACTRQKRAGEVDGTDYYFISEEEFHKRITADDFIEWEEVYKGNFYGTLKLEVNRLWQMHKVVIFDVDVKGAINLKKYFGANAISFFIKPPSKEILFERLTNRATESLEKIEERINKAGYELGFENYFDHSILNDNLNVAVEEITQLIDGFLIQPVV